MGSHLLNSYARVTRDCPCPICGKDNWCLVSLDGETALCQRVTSRHPQGDAGYRHQLDEKIEPPPATAAAPALGHAAVTRFVANARRGADLVWLANNLAVTLTSLHALSVGRPEKDVYSFPMRDGETGSFIGVRLRAASGDKWSLAGGQNGLFFDGPVKSARVVFSPEGPTDTAALADCGFTAAGRPNDRAKVDMLLAYCRRVGARHLVIVADNDPTKTDGRRPGQEAAAMIFDRARPVVPRVSIIQPRRFKDTRECVRYGGGRRTIVEVFQGRTNDFWELVRTTGREQHFDKQPYVSPVQHR